MSYLSRCLTLVVLGFGMCASAMAQTADEKAKARDAIWTMEQGIYENRAKGNLQYYVDNTSDKYVGWPPSAAKPLPLTGLKEDAKRMVGQSKEKLTMAFTDFAMSGNTAVIYYTTKRSVKPDGTPVDEGFENIHVWTREEAGWKLVGAMSRAQPKR
jgi:hypothetical protein